METVLQQVKKKEDKVSKVVDRVLSQVFGREATGLIYKHLECKYGLKRDKIAERIEIFAEGLEDFLTSGAYVVEKKILEDIYSSFGQIRRFEVDNFDNGRGFVTEIRLIMRKA